MYLINWEKIKFIDNNTKNMLKHIEIIVIKIFVKID